MSGKTGTLSRRALLARLLCAPLIAAAAMVGVPAVHAAPKTLRLFAVGNSFSNDAIRMLGSLAKAGGHTLVFGTGSIPGGTLRQHWDKAQKHEADPESPDGLYVTRKGLKEALSAEKWDVVTVQQASILSHDPATYRPYAADLVGYIRRFAPQAKVYVHQTWAYRVDDPRFSVAAPAPGQPGTQRAMYEGLTRAYDGVAAELKLPVLPVGDAFFRADTDSIWGYKPDPAFDATTAAYPKLPDQSRSLHIGYAWRAKEGGEGYTLAMDGHHAGTPGQYLAACVWYEELFGESVEDNPFVPAGVDPAYARFLRHTAHEAVAARRRAGVRPAAD
jgi:hypothetical protein